ncbi:molybdenum cofactor guanylyltransferase [Marinobacterium sediminicola]|uniref:Molybdenum cofactor guanylyltransferase n=1 Tax=Marinobacterium sediminicola TaxID=518898 RepID=A0ABY1S2W2_9GAMM|nr:molybdenum cofactor guanylyltransferase [Marinobacterium sediminicola]ULG68501.1 molybdenum cofactor guanylyltransferase [Marinobacterium sediminicola]SMR76694.1 molybdopterin-guanine dinucleotide biosynthesis protein A [Marinobacterium sediminicola]
MITGLILSGGRGTRVGGADKGLLPWQGRPRVEYSIDALRPYCDQLYLNCSRNPGLYSLYGLPLLTELKHDFPGPLTTLARWLPELPGDAFLILPCDTPGIRPEHIEQLLHAGRQHPEHWLYLTSEGRKHPLHSLIPVARVPQLVKGVESGESRMMRMLQRMDSLEVPLKENAVLNMNTF